MAQRRLGVLDLKRATAIGVVMQRMKCAAHSLLLTAVLLMDSIDSAVMQHGRQSPSSCRTELWLVDVPTSRQLVQQMSRQIIQG